MPVRGLPEAVEADRAILNCHPGRQRRRRGGLIGSGEILRCVDQQGDVVHGIESQPGIGPAEIDARCRER